MKHGMYYTRTYKSWGSMKYRCKHRDDYKERGITYCDRWGDFKEFYADMGDRPEGHTLDRIDNTEGYSPNNCRWATYKQQANNRSSPRHVRSDSKTGVKYVRLTCENRYQARRYGKVYGTFATIEEAAKAAENANEPEGT